MSAGNPLNRENSHGYKEEVREKEAFPKIEISLGACLFCFTIADDFKNLMGVSLLGEMHTYTDPLFFFFLFSHVIPGGTINTPKPGSGNSSSTLKSPISVYRHKCIGQSRHLHMCGSPTTLKRRESFGGNAMCSGHLGQVLLLF